MPTVRGAGEVEQVAAEDGDDCAEQADDGRPGEKPELLAHRLEEARASGDANGVHEEGEADLLNDCQVLAHARDDGRHGKADKEYP